MKKLIRRLLKVLLGLVVGFALFLLAVLIYPRILINNQTLRLARWYLESRHIVTLKWDTASLTAVSKSFWVKQITLWSTNPCFSTPKGETYGCGKDLSLEIVHDVRKGIPRKMGSLPNTVALKLGSAVARAGDLDITGRADMRYEFPTSLKVDAGAQIGPDHKVSLVANSKGTEKEGMNFFADAQYEGRVENAPPRKVSAHLEGMKGLHGVSGEIKASALNVASFLKKVETYDCKISAVSEGAADTATLNCPLRLGLLLPDPAETPVTKYIKPMGILLWADLKRERSKTEKPITGKVGLGIDSVLSQIKEGKAALDLDVSGLLSQFPENWKFDVGGSLVIANFAKIVKLLRNTPAEIPAPLNTLKGEMALNYKGKGTFPLDQSQFTFQLATKLNSATQNLFTNSEGQLSLGEGKGFAPHLKANVNLANIRLVLPAIEYRAPPQFLPDSRFGNLQEADKKEKQKGGKFTYEIVIATPDSNPVTLIADIAKKPVPLFINMVMRTDQPAVGSIKIASFPLFLLRRDARVEYFQLISASVKTETEVKGKINFYYTDYTISLYIDGLLDRPRTRVQSDPPLPEKQALSVLLFGRPMEELDSDQMSSVGNTTAALTDGAITLASMYALASTPVESVGYDPSSRIFSAKLRLADGTSLNLKTDMNQVRQLGVRKRLGPNLGIRSYLEDPFEASTRSLTTLLEWNFLY